MTTIQRLKQVLVAVLVLLASGARAADAILPAPDQLVTMSIQQRLNLFQSMEALPPNQRDANLLALREEINTLTPQQKQDMANRFRTEFAAMPIAQQESLKQQLQAVQQMGGK